MGINTSVLLVLEEDMEALNGRYFFLFKVKDINMAIVTTNLSLMMAFLFSRAQGTRQQMSTFSKQRPDRNWPPYSP